MRQRSSQSEVSEYSAAIGFLIQSYIRRRERFETAMQSSWADAGKIFSR